MKRSILALAVTTLMLVQVFSAHFIVSAFATDIFSDGFESGNFSAWSGTSVGSGSSATVVTEQKHHGSYSAKFVALAASYAKCRKTFTTAQATCFTRFYFRLPSLSTSVVELIESSDNAGSYVYLLEINTNQIHFYRYKPAGVHSYYSWSFQADTWYCIEIKCIRAASPNGEYRVYLNGAEIITDAGLDTTGISVGVKRVDCGAVWNGDTVSRTVYVDCVVAADTYVGEEAVANRAPSLSNPSPADGATGVVPNPVLSIYAKDLDGDLMNITFRTNASGTWKDIGSYTNVGDGTYTQTTTNMGSYGTTYYWSVNAIDTGSRTWTNRTYHFTTRSAPGFLSLKWAVNLPGGAEQITPVMGDINGDGQMEVVVATKRTAVALRGTDGRILWTYTKDGISRAPELCDLTKDGIPEVLLPLAGAAGRQSGLVALFGNGTVYWTRNDLGGNDAPNYPIVAHDIDGDGYPTIFFASTTWTSDLAQLTSITHDGRKLQSVQICHPCTGGLALADYDFDGKFEVYMGDRSTSYDPRGRGMQSWWASDLTSRWNQTEVLASVALPIIADVNGDGLLDVISGNYPYVAVLSAADGSIIKKHSVYSEMTPTVYDIDGDGHLELITSYSKMNAFIVFDLVDSKIDATVGLPYVCIWPPKVADVTGDGNMEIIVAPGVEESTADYDIFIYDKTYSLLQRIPVTGAGQLCPAVAQDIDSDGLNEVVVGGYNAKLLAYDTPAPAPTPRARTEVQFYSQYRRGAAEYVPPPGDNTPPYTTDHNPAPGATEVPINTNIALKIRDAGVGVDVSNIVMRVNGFQVTPTISGTPSSYSVTYDPPEDFDYEETVSVEVDASDLNGNKMATDSYSFTTESYEDFTTYTEVDPNNHIAISAHHIDFDSRRKESAYVYKDKGAGYFSDFEHSVDAKAVTLGDNYAAASIWGLANDVGDLLTLEKRGKTLISIRFQRAGSGDAIYIVMMECYGGKEYFDYYKCSSGTMYYFTIKKSGTALTCKIYSDPARTNLLDTLSLTLKANHSFRYIYAGSTWYDPNLSPDRTIDVDIENLNLQ